MLQGFATVLFAVALLLEASFFVALIKTNKR